MNLLGVDHETRYTYATPVEVAKHLAYLQPLDNGWQRLESFEMSVTPAPANLRSGRDVYGNCHTFFDTAQAHRSLVVHARSRVAVQARQRTLELADTPAWETVRDRLRYAAGAPFEPATEFSLPSPHVPRLAALHDLAAPCFAPGTPVAQGAVRLMRAIYAGFTYETASTTVDTPLAEVLVARCGVCQDFAHLMLGALRMLGLAARYVSGYLLTEAGPGQERGAGPPEAGARLPQGQQEGEATEHGSQHHPIVGADASHAWVAVWCPGLYGDGDDWLELDPTNDLLPSSGHVRLAVGRDYADVAPLRGVIRGGGEHTLEVRVRTEKAQKLLESI